MQEAEKTVQSDDDDSCFMNPMDFYNEAEFVDDEPDAVFKRLSDFLIAEGATEPFQIPVKASRVDMTLMVVKYALIESLSHSSVTRLFTLLNHILLDPIFPDSRYLVDAMFNPLNGVVYHALCPDCGRNIGTFDKQQRFVLCQSCNLSVNVRDPLYYDFFVTLDPSHAIRNLIKEHVDFYDNVVHTRVHEEGVFEDVYDGLEYRKLVENIKASGVQDYCTTIFNTDGAPVFKNSEFAIWPVQLTINEIPPNDRLRNPILCGLWFGKHKPNMNIFLKPFVDMINSTSEKGVSLDANGTVKLIKIFALCCCVDSAARPPMQGLVQYNGYYGCNWCLHPGEYVKDAMKFPLLDETPKMREHDESVEHMRESVESKQRVYGFKNASVLICLNFFNIVAGFVPDYLHNVLLGICVQFSKYWIVQRDPYTLTRFLYRFLMNYSQK